jgi:hypothetical protein
MFRGKPQDTDETALRRQLKKPHRTGETNDSEVRHLTVTEIQMNASMDGGVVSVEDSPEAQPYETLESEVEIEVAEDSDGSEDNIPFSQLKEKIVAEREGLESDEDYTTLPDTNEKMTPKLGLLGIGTEVMKQFDDGLFVGTVLSYNRKDSLYKIEYSDGDMEHMDEEIRDRYVTL